MLSKYNESISTKWSYEVVVMIILIFTDGETQTQRLSNFCPSSKQPLMEGQDSNTVLSP